MPGSYALTDIDAGETGQSIPVWHVCGASNDAAYGPTGKTREALLRPNLKKIKFTRENGVLRGLGYRKLAGS